MGNDTPISALSDRPEAALYVLQAELRAGHQPADRSDPRGTRHEPRLDHRAAANLFRPAGLASTKRLEVRQPILTDADLEKIPRSPYRRHAFQVAHARHTFHAGFGAAGMEQVLDRTLRAAPKARCAKASTSSSVRPMAGSDRIPIPSLLACAAVHHHLIRTGLRTSVGLVVDPASRAKSSLRLPAGYGAERSSVPGVRDHHRDEDRLPGSLDDYEIVKRYIKSIGKGL